MWCSRKLLPNLRKVQQIEGHQVASGFATTAIISFLRLPISEKVCEYSLLPSRTGVRFVHQEVSLNQTVFGELQFEDRAISSARLSITGRTNAVSPTGFIWGNLEIRPHPASGLGVSGQPSHPPMQVRFVQARKNPASRRGIPFRDQTAGLSAVGPLSSPAQV